MGFMQHQKNKLVLNEAKINEITPSSRQPDFESCSNFKKIDIMKTKLKLRTAGSMILMFLLFVFTSCTKTGNDSLTKTEQLDVNTESVTIDEKEFTESFEDLTTVDYREFYDQLTPHGEWIQISTEDVGVKPETAVNAKSEKSSLTLANLFALNDANASSLGEVNMIYVWKPSTDLGVVKVEGEVPMFVPYSNGQWVNTDAGWYFKAPTPAEEIVSHFGRWVHSATDDWLWVPGRVWAPAWVDWKQNETYVSWAPLPPSAFMHSSSVDVSLIDENSYVIVDRKFFLEPAVYKYNVSYPGSVNRVLVSELARTDGIVVLNNTIINRGPDFNVIQTIYGRTIDQVKIKRVGRVNDVTYSEKEYKVYCPGFKRIKNKQNAGVMINRPKSFVKYDDWKSRSSGNNGKGKGNEMMNNNSDNNKKNDGDDNSNYDNGNNNVKKNNGNSNSNRNNESDNVKKNDGNDNGKKNNDNGNSKGNDDKGNGKGNDDNGKGNDDKGNGKGKK